MGYFFPPAAHARYCVSRELFRGFLNAIWNVMSSIFEIIILLELRFLLSGTKMGTPDFIFGTSTSLQRRYRRKLDKKEQSFEQITANGYSVENHQRNCPTDRFNEKFRHFSSIKCCMMFYSSLMMLNLF
jgi:hypothetical protein